MKSINASPDILIHRPSLVDILNPYRYYRYWNYIDNTEVFWFFDITWSQANNSKSYPVKSILLKEIMSFFHTLLFIIREIKAGVNCVSYMYLVRIIFYRYSITMSFQDVFDKFIKCPSVVCLMFANCTFFNYIWKCAIINLLMVIKLSSFSVSYTGRIMYYILIVSLFKVKFLCLN